MQGIEILNTIYDYKCLLSPIWVLVFGVITVASVIGGSLSKSPEIVFVYAWVFIISCVGLLISCICINIPTDRIIDTKYQVIISDDVSLTEFYEHYKIIKQDGKIFTVKEKVE